MPKKLLKIRFMAIVATGTTTDFANFSFLTQLFSFLFSANGVVARLLKIQSQIF